MNPYYQDDYVTLYHGDCREFLRGVSANPELDVVVTDPPYGVDGGRGHDAEHARKAKYDGASWSDNEAYIMSVVVPIIANLAQRAKAMAVTPGVRYLWRYPEPQDMGCFWTPAAATHGPWGFTNFQPILYYGRDPRAGLGSWPTGRQLTEAAEKNGHPCPKPLAAWTWLVRKVATTGDLVVDPFAGSGTTLRAAKNLGLRAVGIEIEEMYCEIAAQRLAQDVLPLGDALIAAYEDGLQAAFDSMRGEDAA